jgi:hypothetical protein
MPFSDPEKEKQYQKEYRLKNKERIKLKNKKWREKNKEYVHKTHKEYYNKPEGLKSSRISTWKNRGIICADWDWIYDIYLHTTHCDKCECLLTQCGGSRKCLDHDHSITDDQNVRGILCNSCNVKDVSH